MKEYDVQVLKAEIQNGISQVDDSLTIRDFNCTYNKAKRNLSINFTASNAEGETVEVSTEMG